jgi:hypothetical protein
MRLARRLAIVLAVAALGAAPAGALTLQFDCLTSNSAVDCAIGESQLSVEVSDLGDDTIRFHFRNSGPEASVISEIYFDDGSLLELATITNGPGVEFVRDANPPNLPGGALANPPFQVTEGFLAEASPSPAQNGVGSGQWVRIDFSLQDDKTLADVIADLSSGELRIGVRVIAFDSDGGESFINAPASVPEPATLLLLSGGLFALVARQRLSMPERSRAS